MRKVINYKVEALELSKEETYPSPFRGGLQQLNMERGHEGDFSSAPALIIGGLALSLGDRPLPNRSGQLITTV